jgi:hypothetical protein
LWNRQYPGDPIVEDGVYGPQTKERLGDAPVDGFEVGTCADEPVDPPDVTDTGDGGEDVFSDIMEDGGDSIDTGDSTDSDSDLDTSTDTSVDAQPDTNDVIGDGGSNGDAVGVDAEEDDVTDVRSDARNDTGSGAADGEANPYIDRVVFGGGGCAHAEGSSLPTSPLMWCFVMLAVLGRSCMVPAKTR